MDQLKKILEGYRNRDRGFPTYDELVALTEAAAPTEIAASAMTLRDYFAGQAMARIVAADKDGCMGPDITAQASYRLADRMLVARGVA
jgi:hypothetical protein